MAVIPNKAVMVNAPEISIRAGNNLQPVGVVLPNWGFVEPGHGWGEFRGSGVICVTKLQEKISATIRLSGEVRRGGAGEKNLRRCANFESRQTCPVMNVRANCCGESSFLLAANHC